jgi:hypothetical protein
MTTKIDTVYHNEALGLKVYAYEAWSARSRVSGQFAVHYEFETVLANYTEDEQRRFVYVGEVYPDTGDAPTLELVSYEIAMSGPCDDPQGEILMRAAHADALARIAKDLFGE